MSFTIFPAIDMRGGKCVRLIQGDYNQETVYGDSIFDMAASFVKEGAEWIHMVDLDGAKEGKGVNVQSVIKVAKELSVNVQVGGGIRTKEDIEMYLNAGVTRVILGSVAVSTPELVKEWVKEFGSRIVIGLDAKDGMVATHGWLETSSISAIQLGKELADIGAETFIFTDIATDGMLSGPNVEAVTKLAEATGKSVIASGGVSSLKDLHTLKAQKSFGVVGSIVGKALYTKQFSLKEALEEVGAC
ncbi:1-(5-phosphoribosyl)-5-[(5-phosphoribosylamino)methylideneamino] imidazole-4-carboxamide isomerase [Bacillus coahuilensis m2-6]|uniref:1-(5-phosphoribosyl)-5-[(5-phosphoribosylamino)methylideneamino] imidazole-4-carboxamide isomerase n=1 Tax=Bacillus coahuilensis p1.1.43 TaxID=1150625 RepID=A0A147K5W3_9BACI|nr:1-(5-phosphoribosyl)-5-[(5-phosphoribosylamino)methylideneamino]imidazole-4-carboxamide isomerase [Bacillus coahuilensis]KUP05205.1 1-(5-phosphoribosyl)-5-[(5-phosphoribosylamino)methylideneamino] imidazole-4-carboxamide isomerase [Bacillus coahuilensis p1.1.43]KUP05656.1 1-(5-phosphoribosyl)-5-[(5-phosphoribosylamino)methylideneamino] imidazole-4-carboxamide isomerase [Bacillus coahuilensis m2-6]